MFKAQALGIWSLASREFVRFYKQKSRVMGALITPVLLWIILGSGLGLSFRTPGAADQGYTEYFFAGILMMVLLFTAIFSMISLIEDRNEGFLQGVQVSPISRLSIVLGKVLGTTSLCLLQTSLLLLLAPMAHVQLTWGVILKVLGVLTLVGLQLGFLGFWMAWRSKTVAGFHVLMNVVLMPMWLISGAVFPGSEAPGWLKLAMNINPMTYSMELMRVALNSFGFLLFPVTTSLLMSFFFLVLFMAISLLEVVKAKRT